MWPWCYNENLNQGCVTSSHRPIVFLSNIGFGKLPWSSLFDTRPAIHMQSNFAFLIKHRYSKETIMMTHYGYITSLLSYKVRLNRLRDSANIWSNRMNIDSQIHLNLFDTD